MLKIEKLFPTLVGLGTLKGAATLNSKLLKDIKTFSSQDKMGQAWSQENYLGGYTSYASLDDMHRRCPSFAEFSDSLQSEAESFAKSQGWSLRGRNLEMTHCWMNVMPKGTYHTLHLHPHSIISGAYYVNAPKNSVALKLEDPRMAFYMNAPLREGKIAKESPLYFKVEPKPGNFVFFESWMRHEVPPNQSKEPRISISFNYGFT